jgi:hypothetical protein
MRQTKLTEFGFRIIRQRTLDEFIFEKEVIV